MTTEKIIEKCACCRLRLPRPSRKLYEYDSNRQKKASPVTPSPKHHSQSSQLNHNSSTTIDRTRTQQSTWERAQKQHTYRSRSYRRRLCLMGGGLVRREPSIRWGLLSTWSTYCCRQIFDGKMRAVGWCGPHVGWVEVHRQLRLLKKCAVVNHRFARSYVWNLCQTEFLIEPFMLKMEFV